jgi:hypothetical protein
MIGNIALRKPLLTHIRGLVFSVLLGLFGGIICGATILSLCGLCGRSRTSGANYVGYWNIGMAFVGAMYGGPLGVAVGPLAYVTLVRTLGFKEAIGPAMLGTISGGFLGSLVNPLFGIPTGVAGFFIALLISRYKTRLDVFKRSGPKSRV